MASRPSLAPFRGSTSQNPTTSPWSRSDGNDLDDLTLPPINPDRDNENNFDLPPFANHRRLFGLEPFTFPPAFSTSNHLPSAPPQVPEQPRDAALPSNQEESSRPRLRRSSFQEQYRISSSPDPYGSFIDLDDLQGLEDLEGFNEVETGEGSGNTTSEMPPTTRNDARRASVVDLTSSPTQSHPPKRKRSTQITSSRKVARTTNSPSRSRPSVPPKDEPVEIVDLADIENEQQYLELQAKKAAELSKKQALDEATKPVKLAHFNCIICMDQPTDLTVTHCGTYFVSRMTRYGANSHRPSILLRMSAPSFVRWRQKMLPSLQNIHHDAALWRQKSAF